MQIIDGEVKYMGTLAEVTAAGANIGGLTGHLKNAIVEKEDVK